MRGINLKFNKVSIKNETGSFSLPILRLKKWGKICKNNYNTTLFSQSNEKGYDWQFRAEGLWHDVTTDRLINDLCPYKIGNQYYLKESWVDVNYLGTSAIMYEDFSISCLSDKKGLLNDDGDINESHPFVKKYNWDIWFEDLYYSKKHWRRANHMPIEASRLKFEITNISVGFSKQYDWEIDFEILSDYYCQKYLTN